MSEYTLARIPVHCVTHKGRAFELLAKVKDGVAYVGRTRKIPQQERGLTPYEKKDESIAHYRLQFIKGASGACLYCQNDVLFFCNCGSIMCSKNEHDTHCMSCGSVIPAENKYKSDKMPHKVSTGRDIVLK